jgi:putative ABC transport system ATP-binding protein
MIELKNIIKIYQIGEQSLTVLKGINLSVKEGEFVAIMGPSGSGKSTLMNIIGLLDIPTSGSYHLDNQNVEALSMTEQARIRGRKIGFIFQMYNLLPRMPAWKQVMVPLIYQGISRHEREIRAREALKIVGLEDKINNRPNQLSGGQQQRVAIARALVINPAIILADEPTGALDTHTGHELMKILRKLNDQGKTIVLITHEKEVANYAKREIHLLDGEIIQS